MITNRYNTRTASERRPNSRYFNEDYFVEKEDLDDIVYEHPIKFDDISIDDHFKLYDKKLPPLHKKYWRPYFSPYLGSWEMDFMILKYKPKHNSRQEKYLYYLFVININTKYLFIEDSEVKDVKIVINTLSRMMNEGLEIDNIRGDYESAFISNELRDWLQQYNIRTYFTKNVYTNRNRIVDRVMRTIRDMVDKLGIHASILNPVLVKQLVNKYNNTRHRSYDFKYTPFQVQANPRIEIIHIQNKLQQLREVQERQRQAKFFIYKPGDFLLVHIPFKKDQIKYKRRRNFTHLARFVGYEHGNVICQPFLPDGIIKNIVLPIYYTKKIRREDLPGVEDYFNFKI
jgi:hypothetical protein